MDPETSWAIIAAVGVIGGWVLLDRWANRVSEQTGHRASSSSELRARSLPVLALWLILAYAPAIYLSPQIPVPRAVGTAGLGLALVLLAAGRDRVVRIDFQRITFPQALFGACAALPFVLLYLWADQALPG